MTVVIAAVLCLMHISPLECREAAVAVVRRCVPRTSAEFMQVVRCNDLAGKFSPESGADLVAVWNAWRSPPPCSIESLASVFEAKRDGVRTCDVTMRVHVTVDPTEAGALSGNYTHLDSGMFWAHWHQNGAFLMRSVAPSREGLESGVDRQERFTDGRSTWSVAGLGEPELQWSGFDGVVGIEDTLLGAGACIGDVRLGTTRAHEHDLGSALRTAYPGTAVVESSMVSVRGVSTVVVRLGWDQPVFLYLDPARGFAPVRIDRQLQVDEQRVLARTEMAELERVGQGLWLPRRVRLQQCLVEDGFGNGRRLPGPVFLEVDRRVVRLSVGDVTCDETTLAGP